MNKRFKVVVFVPKANAEQMRTALGEAGAGVIGNYSFCTFSTKGIGRFLPGTGANPYIGAVGVLDEVQEERIETVCSEEKLPEVLEAIRRVHPYEEPALDVYPIEVI